MSTVDANSPTWKAVEKFIEQELAEAFDMLVADKSSDHQRGAIHLLDRLTKLPNDPIERVVADNYE